MFVPININKETFIVNNQISILSACSTAGITLPRFCFHENLAVAGNCRVCLVELEHLEKPVASCVMDVEANQNIFTNSLFAKKARENVLEILLANHPLDCPICDQAGECDLQDQSKVFGGEFTRFFLKKRSVTDKNFGLIIKTIMTRCIHCTRCIRFDELLENNQLGMLNRGVHSEIGTYFPKNINSNLSGNVIDLCPVGALTARNYAFQARPWELKVLENLDLTDGLGSNVYFNYKDLEIVRITPKPNNFINGNLITDNCRVSGAFYTSNRLKKIYEYNKINANIKSHTWFSFLNKIDKIQTDDKINIIINGGLDVFSILFLKKLSNKSCSQIKLLLLKKIKFNSNAYIYKILPNFNSFIKEGSNCFLLGLNLNAENSILAFKLKLKYQYTLVSIYCFAKFYTSAMKIDFVNINLSNLILLIEGKSTVFISLLSSICPLIFMGDNLLMRLSNYNIISSFLRNKIRTLDVLNVHLLPNENGISFLNVCNLIYKKSTKLTLCVNLEDSVQVRKYIFQKMQNVWWLNTHRPFFHLKAAYLIPLSTHIESESVFISLENKIQKTQKTFKSLYYSLTCTQVCNLIFKFDNSEILKKNLYLNFLFEVLKRGELNTLYTAAPVVQGFVAKKLNLNRIFQVLGYYCSIDPSINSTSGDFAFFGLIFGLAVVSVAIVYWFFKPGGGGGGSPDNVTSQNQSTATLEEELFSGELDSSIKNIDKTIFDSIMSLYNDLFRFGCDFVYTLALAVSLYVEALREKTIALYKILPDVHSLSWQIYTAIESFASLHPGVVPKVVGLGIAQYMLGPLIKTTGGLDAALFRKKFAGVFKQTIERFF